MDRTRRRMLAGTAGALTFAAAPSLASLLAPTPRQTRGPFYPDELPLDADNDLVHVAGRSDRARGVITDLAGCVLDRGGEPVDSARVEIWQCDANGRYHHVGAGAGGRDPNFQGFGSFTTDREGRYRFRTIRPVPYPGRTPHIHFRIVAPGMPELVTQMYIAGHPMNADDGIFRRTDGARRHLAVAFEPAAADGAEQRARFDIVLAG